MCESTRRESAANRAHIAATEAAKQARNAASASQGLTKRQRKTAQRRRKAANKANLKAKRKPKTEPTATQKAFAYHSSAEFVNESLHAGGAQRHNKDNISLPPSHEATQATRKRLILNRELAALEKRKKEQAQQERIARAAEKSAQGLAEVVIGCVVTLCYIDENEMVSYYVLSDEIRGYRGKIPVYVERYDTPPHGADTCLRADAELAKAIVGAFMGDEVEVCVPSGALKCRVMSVTNHTGDKSNERAVVPRKEMPEGQTHDRIGSETYAFFARDNGSFGSISAHDDYSDEADAEVHGAEAHDNENAS